jgi:hypothetical protein
MKADFGVQLNIRRAGSATCAAKTSHSVAPTSLRLRGASPATQEKTLAKPNYHQARKQKELARKARQQEKQQRRSNPRQAEAAVAPEPSSGGEVLPQNRAIGEELK